MIRKTIRARIENNVLRGRDFYHDVLGEQKLKCSGKCGNIEKKELNKDEMLRIKAKCQEKRQSAFFSLDGFIPSATQMSSYEEFSFSLAF